MTNDVFNDVLDLINTNNLSDGYTLVKVNHWYSSIALFLGQYWGILDKYLKHYIGLYKLKKYWKKEELVEQYKKPMNSKYQLRFKDLIVNLILAWFNWYCIDRLFNN